MPNIFYSSQSKPKFSQTITALSKHRAIKNATLTAFEDCSAVEHCREHVSTINNVDYINDSIATNVNRTWYSMEQMTKPFVWIAGGQNRSRSNESMEILVDLLRDRCVGCVFIGEKSSVEDYMQLVTSKHLSNYCYMASTMANAIAMAMLIKGKKIVLLSPARPSFDYYKNYEERGRVFKEIVKSY